jgi:hypothetical protein
MMFPNHIPSTVVRQHWYVLILPLLGAAALLSIVLICAVTLAEPLIAVGATLITGLFAAARVRAWFLFAITFTAQWVVVQESRFGIPQTTSYPYVSIRSTTCFQGPLGWLYDSGTLTLTLATHTRRFTGLTPYSLLATVLA